MIGTEKQVAYATDLIANARAWYTGPKQVIKPLAQIKAVEAIEAVERGDIEAAEAALTEAAEWVGDCFTAVDGAPRVDAARVIERLRRVPRI